MVYHFGGLSSVIPTEMLEKLDFYPGNFGPQYGRAMGGVVDVGVRSPRKDRFGGLLQFDLIDGRLLVEGPLSKKHALHVGGPALLARRLDRTCIERRRSRRDQGAGLLRLPSDGGTRHQP